MRARELSVLGVLLTLAVVQPIAAQEEGEGAAITIDYLYPLTAEYGLPSRVLVDYVERAFDAEYRQWGAHELLADQSLEVPRHVSGAAWSFVTGAEGDGTWLWVDGELVTKYWWDWKQLPEVITQQTGFAAKEVGVRLLAMGPDDIGDPTTGAGATLLELWGVVGFLVCDGPERIGVIFVHPKDKFPLTDDRPAPEQRVLSVSAVRGDREEGPLGPEQWQQALAQLTQWAGENGWKRIEAGGTADVATYYRWCQRLPRDWYAAAGFTVAEVQHDVHRQALENMRDGFHGQQGQDEIRKALAAGMTVDGLATTYNMVWEAQ